MGGRVPFDFNRVACFGVTNSLGAWNGVAVYVAGDVVGLNIGDGIVRWWHPDTHLIARRYTIDPKLVEILVCMDGGEEERKKECSGMHFGRELHKRLEKAVLEVE